MPCANAIGEFMAGIGQENAAVGQRGGQALPLKPGYALNGGRMRNAETFGDIGCPCLAAGRQEIGDEFRIIFQQRGRSCRARFAEPAGLGGLRWHFNG
jgi:hypothetical protein